MNNCSIAVVHLVRRSNGIDAFRRFLSSYNDYEESQNHDLVIIFKDFGKESGNDKEYLDILSETPFIRYDFCADSGYDLGPYFDVGKNLIYNYYLFLNSFSEIECNNWLTIMLDALRNAPNAGIVGATGSWESAGSDYPKFPNPSIRTNAFLIPRKLLQKVRIPKIETKEDALHIESGNNSITRQIIELGRIPYVVNSTGRYFKPDEWNISGTFRSFGQEYLIISDNRTRDYTESDTWAREYLYDLAWVGKTGSANPFKRHKLKNRVRRFCFRNRTERNL